MTEEGAGVRAFSSYPPEARALAASHAALLARLPLPLRAVLLREVVGFDWKFPAERKDTEAHFAYLEALKPADYAATVDPFAKLTLSEQLRTFDVVSDPRNFVEQMTAYLWATSQMDAFRTAADGYANGFNASPLAPKFDTHSLCIVVLGHGVGKNTYPLFRKLRSEGVHFPAVEPGPNGLHTLLAAAATRAAKSPEPYAHWYVDGGDAAAAEHTRGLQTVSFGALAPVRAALTKKMQTAAQSGEMGPEGLRTLLARLRPEDLGMRNAPAEAVRNTFQVNLLTEGSGTQVYSTTFVQWAGRELYRRARPSTLLLRFAPRQRARPLNELIADAGSTPELDPQGSLIDADMGAYYTWINQKRVAGRERASFLAWFEGQNEAFAIGPNLPQGTTSGKPAGLPQLLEWIA